MKKIILLFVGSLLFGCGGASSTITSFSSSFAENGVSSLQSISVEESVSSVSIDYSLFHSELVGTWYIHSSNMGVLNANVEMTIAEDYTMTLGNLKLYFVGIYDKFTETNVFESESKITKVIVSLDEDTIDWAFMDEGGNQDFGIARKTELTQGITYSYIGPTWPIEQVNAYLGTTGSIPLYLALEYNLYLGVSALYGDAPYAMIEIFNVTKYALEDYVQTLKDNEYIIAKKDSFHIGYDKTKTYGVRLIEYDDNDLCIFIYTYASLIGEYVD